MNSNEKKDIREEIPEEETGGKSRRSNIISFIVCVLIAFVLWLIIMNVADEPTTLPLLAGDGSTSVCEVI